MLSKYSKQFQTSFVYTQKIILHRREDITILKPSSKPPIIQLSRLVLDATSNPLLERRTGAKSHGDITSVLTRLAALGGQIVVPDEVSLDGVVSVGREMGNSAVAVGGRHADTAIVSSAVGAVNTAVGTEVHAVDERDVVPEAVGNSVLELGDSVGPHEVGVLGDLQGGVGSNHLLTPRGTGGDRSLDIGAGAPTYVLDQSFYYQCR